MSRRTASAGILVKNLLQGEEVAKGLRHLLAVHAEHARVHPHVRKRAAPRAHGLRGLVLVVREDQVLAATVDVDGRTQVAVDHGAALRVPAGTAVAPRARPAGLAGLGGLPQRKVKRVALLVVHLDALAGAQLVKLAPREDAVVVV
jgi:hypothetical protein